uniref:CSON015435 protein n=1 Tax=Culicoides sonorensis TaxID=179676 RepID=A0A336LPD4_CULSO
MKTGRFIYIITLVRIHTSRLNSPPPLGGFGLEAKAFFKPNSLLAGQVGNIAGSIGKEWLAERLDIRFLCHSGLLISSKDIGLCVAIYFLNLVTFHQPFDQLPTLPIDVAFHVMYAVEIAVFLPFHIFYGYHFVFDTGFHNFRDHHSNFFDTSLADHDLVELDVEIYVVFQHVALEVV